MANQNDSSLGAQDSLYRDVIECMTSGVAAFRAVRDAASGAIVDFTWILHNAYAEKVTGRPEIELIGKRLLKELPEHGPTGLFERYRQVVETGAQDEFTVEYHDKGVNGVFRARVVKMGDGVAVAFTDITEEVERRRVHDTVADRLAVATRSAGIGLWELDADTNEVTWDEITCRLLGHDPEVKPSYESWRAVVHADDLPEVRRLIIEARNAGAAGEAASFGIRFRVRGGDGSVRHIQSHAQFVASADRRRLVGVNWDVTAEAEQHLAHELLASRFALATECAGIGIWEHNIDTGERMWDETTFRLFDCDPSEPDMMARWRSSVHPDDLEQTLGVIAATRASEPGTPESSFRSQFRVIRPNGAIRHLESHGRLVVSGNGRRLVGVNRDRTAEVVAARELEEKRREAEAANIAKSQFLAVMSHEIRTPLNGVLGMAALLQQSELNDRQRALLKTIERSGDELLEILNGILDLSRIESGRIEIEEAPFDLDELLSRASGLFSPQAAEKGLDFRFEVGARAQGRFLGDGTRVRQVLYNLLSNALKFTSRGEIVTSVDLVHRSEKDGSSLELVLAVRDTGIGVPADKLERIFKPFTQVDGSTTRRFGGAGLGLSIAAALAELLGGSIAVQSEEGAGSTFTARLRVAPIATDLAPAAAPADVSDAVAGRPRVLLAEDNHTNQIVLSGLLRACGAEPTLVENGLLALEAWAAGDYDLILLDIMMPVMDGVAAAKEIRRLEAKSGRPRTPIVAVSADAMTHQVETYLAAGMDAHLAKPVRPAELISAMRSHIPSARPSGGAAVPPRNAVGGA
jgi:signal transduction histidine kinase